MERVLVAGPEESEPRKQAETASLLSRQSQGDRDKTYNLQMRPSFPRIPIDFQTGVISSHGENSIT